MEEVGKSPPSRSSPTSWPTLRSARLDNPPDVVILVGKPGKIMMLMEAAGKAGVITQFPVLGRPTCMSLPAAMQSGVVGSSGCIGNRVYTEISDDDLYVAIRGTDLEKVVGELQSIINANSDLREYHRTRKKALTND